MLVKYIPDGEVHTCQESIEAIDEENKTIKLNLFGGDVNKYYKTFKLIIEVIDKNDGAAAVKWTIDIEPPHGYMKLYDKCTKEVDAYVLKAQLSTIYSSTSHN